MCVSILQELTLELGITPEDFMFIFTVNLTVFSTRMPLGLHGQEIDLVYDFIPNA